MNNDCPLVSIVIPVYNSEHYLEQCLESVLNQTYENTEIICVDDGSTDGSLSILNRFKSSDNRVRIISQKNAGPGAARNVGMDFAKGEYLYFFDSDDYCEKTLIEKVVEQLQVTDADLAVFPFCEYSQLSGIAKRPNWSLLGDKFHGEVFSWRDNPDWIFEEFQNFPWNKMLKTSFVRKHNLRYQEINLTEDLMFSAPALVLAQSITWVNEPLVFHRIETGSNVMANKDAHPLDFLSAFLSLKRFLERNELFDNLRVAFANWAINGCIYNLHTLNTRKCFCEVYDSLAENGAYELGLFDIEESDYRNDQYREFLSALKATPASEYADLQYRLAIADRDHYLFLAQDRQLRLERLEGELSDAYERLQSLNAEYTAFREMHERLMNAAEQRIGRAICRIPRAIQRAYLERKKAH